MDDKDVKVLAGDMGWEVHVRRGGVWTRVVSRQSLASALACARKWGY